jgi:hypothetical protein
MSEWDAAERLRDNLAQYYGPEVTRVLFPPADDSEGEVSGSELMSDAVAPWISGERASSPPGGDEHLVMAALLVLLHEGGGRHKVTFMLPELLGLLGWPVAESSWEAVERALDFYMQLVQREYCVSPPGSRGREVRVTSLRRLVAGHEYYEESEYNSPESIRLAGRQVTVTFNTDVPLGAGPAGLKSHAEGF